MPLSRFLALRARRRWLIAGVATAVLFVMVAADRVGLIAYAGGDMGRYHGKTFLVAKVIDGDTLDIDIPDGEQPLTRVRLWGVDAPERPRPWAQEPGEPFGEDAALFARKHCEGVKVTLSLQSHRQRGRYGRLLAYVHLSDGRSLNEMLIEAGLARADPRFSHAHNERYALLEQQAMHDGVGLWGED